MRNCWLQSCLVLLAMSIGCHGRVKESPADFPAKSVTIICPWAAGGGTDQIARFWAEAFSREFEQPFVVLNKTGGSGAVGHMTGAHARPDGYTITMITCELSTMHRMGVCDLNFEDYECLLQINGDAAAILVRDDAPWKTLPEILDYARQNPGRLKMSGTATGGVWDLARAGLQHAAEVPVESIVWVPTMGAAPSLVELLGGHIDAVCCSMPEATSQLEAGQLRALAVMAEERPDDYPDVPTAREQDVDWVAVGWRGLALPKGTPPEIVDRLVEKGKRIAASQEYADFMKKRGYTITVRAKDEYREFLAQQDGIWKEVIEAAGYSR